MTTSKRIFFFTRYGTVAASTRYRFCQYIPALQAQGFECHLFAFFSDAFYNSKVKLGTYSFFNLVIPFLRALKQLFLFRKTDLILVHKEFFPFFPPIFEWLIVKTGRRIIYEFDDAFFVSYEDHRFGIVRLLLKNKIRSIIKSAFGVIAGNEYLADYARNENGNVRIIPTVVDLNRYTRIKKAGKKDFITIGWIGSPSTSSYLKLVEPVLQEFFLSRKGTVFVIGASQKYLPVGVPLTFSEWSEEGEIEQLLAFDVGIMPVPDIRWTQGKCGFKIIQYLACGIPAIASPVGKNSELITDGINGFLPRSPEGWLKAFIALYESPALRARMGAHGRSLIEKHYSLQSMTENYIQFINSCAHNTILQSDNRTTIS